VLQHHEESVNRAMESATNGDVFVLGSGYSLLSLTHEQRAYVQSHTTVAMNKYLLFWEKIGIWPDYYFLADYHWPAVRVYEESIRVVRRAKRPMHFLLEEIYRDQYGLVHSPMGWARMLRRIAGNIKRHRYVLKPWLTPETATYFRGPRNWEDGKIWADSLYDKMYFRRGSLTVLLNLCAVLRLGTRIKLVGVDLNDPRSFFDEELRKRPELWDRYVKGQHDGMYAKHATVEKVDGMQPMTSYWPEIMDHLSSRGVELCCCNNNSLLVEENLCPYTPLDA